MQNSGKYIISADSLNTRGCTSSGPIALLGFMDNNNFSTSSYGSETFESQLNSEHLDQFDNISEVRQITQEKSKVTSEQVIMSFQISLKF